MNTRALLLTSALTLGCTGSTGYTAIIEWRALNIPVTNLGDMAATDDSWTFDPRTNHLSGTEGLGFLLYGETLNSDFTGITQISITANVTSAAFAPTNGFIFLLLDAQDDTVTGVFKWVDFIGGATVTVDLTNISPSFDYNNIIGWSLISGGSNAPISVTFGTVPEPSAYGVAAGLFAMGACIHRRRRVP